MCFSTVITFADTITIAIITIITIRPRLNVHTYSHEWVEIE